MALRFPRKKVALDIVDRTAGCPEIVQRNGWTVLRVTDAQVEDPRAFRAVMHTLAELLGSTAPEHPDWEANSQLLRAALLAAQEQDAA